MINPVVAYATGGALLVGLFAGWTVRDWKADADTVAAYEKADKIRNAMQVKIDEAEARSADAQAVLESANYGAQSSIREIYREKQVPGDCALPSSAVGVLEDARRRANAASSGELSAAVPRDTADPSN